MNHLEKTPNLTRIPHLSEEQWVSHLNEFYSMLCKAKEQGQEKLIKALRNLLKKY